MGFYSVLRVFWSKRLLKKCQLFENEYSVGHMRKSSLTFLPFGSSAAGGFKFQLVQGFTNN